MVVGGDAFDGSVRTVRVDGVVSRRCARAARSIGWPAAALASVACGCLLFVLLGLLDPAPPPGARTLVAVLVGPVGVLAVLVLRGRDAGRSAPVGATLTAQLTHHGVRAGVAGQETTTSWAQLAGLREWRGHLVLVRRGADAEPVVLPPALLREGDVERARQHVRRSRRLDAAPPVPGDPSVPPQREVLVDATLARRVGADAAAVLAVRRRGPLLLALAAGAALVSMAELRLVPYATSIAVVCALAIRLLTPAVQRRRIRRELLPEGQVPYGIRALPTPLGFELASGDRRAEVHWDELRDIVRARSAVVVLPLDGPRLVLPADAFAPGVVDAGVRALASRR